MKLKIFIISFLLILLMATLILDERNRLEPKTIAWVPYWDQVNAVSSFEKNSEKIDYVSVFWYTIDQNGKIKKYEDATLDFDFIEEAQRKNVKVLALIANLSEGEENIWDHRRVDKAISDGASRRKHVQELVKLVEENNFDGLDIDYEALKAYQKENFSLFIKELSSELQKRDKILGIAIHPKTSEDNPLEDNGSHAQDLKVLGRYADQLYLMTYLEHGAFSEPGPIGSIGWMEKVADYALTQVPKNKLYLGIGLMGTRWENDGAGNFHGIDIELTFSDVLKIAQDNGLTPIWDEFSKTPYLEYQSEGKENIVWFENAESVEVRLALAKRLKTGGIALWRLGGEDERIWGMMK